MPITSFRVENQKAIRLAECNDVPSIMVIAGPNGVGKSTLLYCLRTRTGQINISGKVLYLPAHRTWRKQKIRAPYLWGAPRKYSDALSSDTLSAFEGFRVFDASRTPDSADEAISLVKYTLGQMETRRQSVIAERYDKNEISHPEGTLSEVYSPLLELTRLLLPHLEFSRVDISDRENVRCLWKRASGLNLSYGPSIEIDIDELSSGEKSIIALFLPFIETQIDSIIKRIEGDDETKSSPSDVVVLIDEPELHLHPALQVRMLDYLRAIVSKGGVQFIVATHSSTFFDTANEQELYILTPKPDWPDPANQLIRLANSAERLEAMRILCGDTYPATACRAIICVEGELPEGKSHKSTDKRILEMLCPDFKSTVIIPMGGKNEVARGANRLREVLPMNVPGLNVFAIVDRDQAKLQDNGLDDWIFKLPVCMLENFLLVPTAIDRFIEPYREHTKLLSAGDIENALREIAHTLRDDEISIRLQHSLKLKPIHVLLSGASVESIKERHNELIQTVEKSLPKEEELRRTIRDATLEVDAIIERKEEFKFFRGKQILREFYNKHIHSIGFSFHGFCIELARHVAKEEHATKLLGTVIAHIMAFVPEELKAHLEKLRMLVTSTDLLGEEIRNTVISNIDTTLRIVTEAIQERRNYNYPKDDRSVLRRDIMTMARAIEGGLAEQLENCPKIINSLKDVRMATQKIANL